MEKEVLRTGEFRIRMQASAILPPGIEELPLRLVMGYNLNINLGFVQLTVRIKNLSYRFNPRFCSGLNKTSYEYKVSLFRVR